MTCPEPRVLAYGHSADWWTVHEFPGPGWYRVVENLLGTRWLEEWRDGEWRRLEPSEPELVIEPLPD